MTFRIYILPLALLAFLLVAQTGCHRAARRSDEPVSILVSGSVGSSLPRLAALADARRAGGRTLWLAAGPVLSDTLAVLVTDGAGPLELLTAAGPDAAVFDPGMLAQGVEPARRLVAATSLHLLSCNLVDSAGEPLGHPMLISRLDGAAIGLTAAWTDSTDFRLRQRGVRFEPVDRAVAQTRGLLRMRCDVTGIVTNPPGTGSVAGFDFAIGGPEGQAVTVSVPTDPELVTRLDLYVRGGSVSDYRVVEEHLSDWSERTDVRRVADSLQLRVDSMLDAQVVNSNVHVKPEVLGRVLVTGRLRDGIDGFLTDEALFRSGLGSGPITVRALIAAMDEPGRLCVFDLTGWEIKQLTEDRAVELQWRTALKHMRMAMSRSYRLAATPGFLHRHALAAVNGYEVDSEAAWRIMARLLADGR